MLTTTSKAAQKARPLADVDPDVDPDGDPDVVPDVVPDVGALADVHADAQGVLMSMVATQDCLILKDINLFSFFINRPGRQRAKLSVYAMPWDLDSKPLVGDASPQSRTPDYEPL